MNKVGDVVMLVPKSSEWEGFLTGINLFSDDFMEDGRALQKHRSVKNYEIYA